MVDTDAPTIIEVAISPLRRGVPAQTAEEMVDEAARCIQAGAGIVHHHHDMRLEEDEAIQQLIDTGAGIQKRHPGTLVYTDYLTGRKAWEENAHLQPMFEAGVLGMFAIDPGITAFPSNGKEGLPTRTYTDGLRFSEAHEMVEFSKERGLPISLGVFEPGQLRWIVAYNELQGFSPGTVIKLYFGGKHTVEQLKTPGINFGLPGTTAALDVYLSMMEGCSLPWTVSLFGDPILDSPLARHALENGGHIRVGIEDAAGVSDLNNEEMVAVAKELVEDVGRPIAVGQAASEALRAS